ncbi:hypothetical protein IJH02_00640 [Candidatus Saccharibacteria bacterium]|nr:hypothetical protein [Candidatus Saccharibacteria bacterium]
MNKLKQKARRLKYKLTHGLSVNRVLVLLFIACCLAWTYGAIVSLSRNWQLEQRIINKRREVKLLELEVDTLELENQYYASEEYQELAAREKENKLLPGESLVYLPKNSEAAKNKHKEIDETAAVAVAEVKQPSNFRQWLSFLLGL